MRLVIQRVSSASVTVDNVVRGEIAAGLMVLVGFATTDTAAQLPWAADKLANLRIFEDAQEKMNLSVLDTKGSILLVPNFTLAGNAQQGRRPSFDTAMRPEQAEPMFQSLAKMLTERNVPTQTGVFRAHMQVALVNNGPITLVIDVPPS